MQLHSTGYVRPSGIDIIGGVNWGTHLCQFYKTKEDLLDILVPFFKSGLETNEFCMWVVSEPLEVEDAYQALSKAVPNLELYINKGQLEIISYANWYVDENLELKKLEKILEGWVCKLKCAESKGFDGMRVTGNTYWLEENNWKDFIEYEKVVDNSISEYPILAICTYAIDNCKTADVLDVVSSHQQALVKQKGEWKLIISEESQRLKRQLQQVQHADSQKEEFITTASHELKTPVTSIKGYAQILEKYISKDEVSKMYLSKMNNQINRLTELVNGLLDVSKIQSDKMVLTKEEFNLTELVESVLDDMQHITTSHKLYLKKSPDIIVNADKFRLNQVVVNLISNAIKYSPDASEVIVDAKDVPGGVVVKVEDFGIGIKEEDKGKIFDRFFQATSKMRQSYFGLGLGLYISSEIIKNHGGRIWVESEFGKGSQFYFYLPLR